MKRILAYPQVYNLYQNMIGSGKYLNRFVNEFVQIKKGISILDLGCGTANVLQFFDDGIEYTGIDLSQKYIDYSKKKYPKQTFICSNICSQIFLNTEFDIIISEGVMVALTDQELYKVFKNIVINSNKNTRIILSDSDYKQAVSPLERFFINNQRYKNFRTKGDYIKLIEQFFDIKKVIELEKVYRIPYSKIVFECSIKN